MYGRGLSSNPVAFLTRARTSVRLCVPALGAARKSERQLICIFGRPGPRPARLARRLNSAARTFLVGIDRSADACAAGEGCSRRDDDDHDDAFSSEISRAGTRPLPGEQRTLRWKYQRGRGKAGLVGHDAAFRLLEAGAPDSGHQRVDCANEVRVKWGDRDTRVCVWNEKFAKF